MSNPYPQLAGLYLRPSPTVPARFEVVDPKTRRRVLVDGRLVQALVRSEGEQAARAVAALHARGLGTSPPEHSTTGWLSDAWRIAAGYLYASQQAEFHDSGDEYREAQSDAVASYLTGDPMPVADSLIDGEVRGHIEQVNLPPVPISECFLRRRTPQTLSGQLSFDALQQILWYSFSYPRRHRHPEEMDDFRAYFNSFGSAFDIMLAAPDVEGVTPGWYWYRLTDSALVSIHDMPPHDVSARLDRLTNQQGVAPGAAAAIVLIARLDRYRWRYRHDRALRNVYVEAGRLGQSIALIAAGLQVDTWFSAPLEARAVQSMLGRTSFDDSVMYGVLLGGTPVGHDDRRQE